jgi:hypothetical protein
MKKHGTFLKQVSFCMTKAYVMKRTTFGDADEAAGRGQRMVGFKYLPVAGGRRALLCMASLLMCPSSHELADASKQNLSHMP